MRRLLIDEKDLQYVLLKRKAFIGGSLVSGISLLIGGIHELQGFQAGSWISYLLFLLGLFMIGIAIREVCKGLTYDYKKLGKEITDLDQTAHHHSIVAIRDSFEKYPNRFLVYQDEAWHCRLFLNYPTQSDKEKNVAFIKEKISHALKIPVEDISLREVTQALQQKYSEKHHEMRVYDHVFYEAHISSFPDVLQAASFSIDGVMYYWMTLTEMKQDADIKKKNLDVVEELEKHM